MKKIVNLSFFYAILAMIAGVFYREFTKFNDFTGVTTLGVIHTHLFTLGMIFMLIVAILEYELHLKENRKFKAFMVVYNSGVIFATIMFLVRGIPQVLNKTLSSGLNAAISGMAGISHFLLAIGIVLFFLIVKGALEKNTAE